MWHLSGFFTFQFIVVVAPIISCYHTITVIKLLSTEICVLKASLFLIRKSFDCNEKVTTIVLSFFGQKFHWKSKGGLGIRGMTNFNNALIAKLGRNVLTKTYSQSQKQILSSACGKACVTASHRRAGNTMAHQLAGHPKNVNHEIVWIQDNLSCLDTTFFFSFHKKVVHWESYFKNKTLIQYLLIGFTHLVLY